MQLGTAAFFGSVLVATSLAAVAPPTTAPAPRGAPGGPASQPRAAITSTDPREHWLSIVFEFLPDLGRPTQASPPGSLLVPRKLSSEAPLRRASNCSIWMIWLPVSVPSQWSEVDARGTRFSWVRRGRNGEIDAIPMELAATPPASGDRRWYWGAQPTPPDRLSQWRLLQAGPYCDCCAPGCHDADNPEAEHRGVGLELHVRSAQPVVNWDLAAALPWQPVTTELQPFLEPAPYIETGSPAVQAFVRHWVGDAPRTQSPWRVALALARGAAARADNSPTGDPIAATRGLVVAGAANFASTGKGNVNDAHCLAVAAMRAAGIPARVVIGFEVVAQPGGFASTAVLDCWGEFWIGDAGWIPFDCDEMQSDARGNPSAGAKIDGFGAPSGHNRRIAWSWYFDAPFPSAVARRFPAGIAAGPGLGTAEEIEELVGQVARTPEERAKILSLHGERVSLLTSIGALGATARSRADLPARWPDAPASR
ncbi:MAG: transglutaminase domain-containing protein [Phycisphaerales bacterium]